MKKRVNTTFIGAFILGALALAVGIVIVFGSINFLHPRPVGVSYFTGDVGGLNVGAPANLHGVRIGAVSKINVEADPANFTTRVAVYMEFEPERLVLIGPAPSYVFGSGQGLRNAIERGLTAQLESQSLVTGQLQVDLAIIRDAAGKTLLHADAEDEIPEIPTIPSEIEQLKSMISRLPIDRIMAVLEKTADAANQLLASPELPDLIRSMVEVVHDTHDLIGAAHGQVSPLAASAKDTLADVQQTLAEMRATLGTANEVVGTNVRSTLKAAEGAMQQATVTLNGANSIVTASSPQRADINQTLHNLTVASQSLRLLSEQLERRPNAILLGK